jgi:asparagine synthase (glutamine-hydrolysing)
MSELEANPINTFTIGSKKAGEFNEFLYAEAVATRYKTHHYEENIAYGNLEDLINKIIWHFDEPVSDDASFPLYMISKFAGTRVKVLLSGEGGDEVFGGYNIYGKMMLLNKARGIPLIGKMLPWAEKYISDAKVLNYMKLLRIPLDQGYFGVASVFSEDDKIKLVSVDVKKTFNAGLPERFRSYYDKTKGLSPLQRMQYIDIKTWLPDELLIKADKMSMANSIELRVPLLDHKLVEYAFNLPDKFKANAWNSKIILRNMMKKRLPDKILKRRKVGFDIPLESWLKNDLFEFTRELLLSKRSQERGYFNSNYVRELIDQHVSGRRNNVEKIWSLITLEAWHRKFID